MVATNLDVSQETKDKLREIAKIEKRSMNKEVAFLIEKRWENLQKQSS